MIKKFDIINRHHARNSNRKHTQVRNSTATAAQKKEQFKKTVINFFFFAAEETTRMIQHIFSVLLNIDYFFLFLSFFFNSVICVVAVHNVG